MSGGILMSSPGKAGTGGSEKVTSGSFSTFLGAAGCATTVAFGGTQDTSAIAKPSSAQVVIFEMIMMNSCNSGAAARCRKKAACGSPRKAEA